MADDNNTEEIQPNLPSPSTTSSPIDFGRNTSAVSIENNPNANAKVTFQPGVRNIQMVRMEARDSSGQSVLDDKGNVVLKTMKTYTRFESARLIRVSAREQLAPRADRNMVVVSMQIIFDGLEVGVLDDGVERSHPLLADPVYKNYKQWPLRIKAQQWMDFDFASKLLQPLAAKLTNLPPAQRFLLDLNPRKAENRSTRDTLVLRPVNRIDPDNVSAYGVPLSSFEVSINPNYDSGFRSFWQGLEDQKNRIDEVARETDPDLRAKRMEILKQNFHFVSGCYFIESSDEYWPRPVDIGVLSIDNEQFPLYNRGGAPATVETFAGIFAKTSTQVASEVASGSSTPIAFGAPTATAMGLDTDADRG